MRWACGLAATALLAAASAGAQTLPIGQPIVTQSVTLDGRTVTDPGILDLIETSSPGRALEDPGAGDERGAVVTA